MFPHDGIFGFLISPDLEGSLQDVVTKFWNTNESVDDAAKAIAAALKNG